MKFFSRKANYVGAALLVATLAIAFGWYKLSDGARVAGIEAMIFQNKTARDHIVSPDGKLLAWRSFDGATIDVVVTNVADMSQRARFKDMSGRFLWAPGSTHLMFWRDASGAQVGNLWVVDVSAPTLAPRNLTNLAQGSAGYVGTTKDAILIETNARDRKVFDLYALRGLGTTSEALSLIATNTGNVVQWLTDSAGVRGKIVQDGEARNLETTKPDGTTARRVLSWKLADTLAPVGFNADATAIYVATNIGMDKIALCEVDLASGDVTLLYNNPTTDVDVEENIPVLAPRTRAPMAVVSEPDYPSTKLLHEALRRALQPTLDGPSRVTVLSVDDNETLATVKVFSQRGLSYRLVNMVNSSVKDLAQLDYWTAGSAHILTKPVRFTARDGVTLNGYLTLPPSSEKALGPVPMVVRVHGGPWYRNTWGNTDLDAAATQVKFLASRGYGVLEVNFRGSTGYGKQFKEAAIQQFGKAMQADLIDGVKWAVESRVADPRQIAIMGASYGGYAALMGVSDAASPFACGVAAAAPTDLPSMIEGFPPEWAQEMHLWTRYVGDPKVGESRAAMMRVSPITLTENIKVPLLLLHGQRDEIVSASQAATYEKALKAKGKKVSLVTFADEGHVITGVASQVSMYKAIDSFLRDCLGREKN